MSQDELTAAAERFADVDGVRFYTVNGSKKREISVQHYCDSVALAEAYLAVRADPTTLPAVKELAEAARDADTAMVDALNLHGAGEWYMKRMIALRIALANLKTTKDARDV